MGDAQNGKDRRSFPRYSKDISVDISGSIFPVYEKMNEAGEGKDISVAGLCFFSNVPYEKGARLTMSVRITNREDNEREEGILVSTSSIPITTIGEVVRVVDLPEQGGYEIGIKFLDITEDDYRILIRRLAKE